MDIVLHIFSEILALKELKSLKDKAIDKNVSEKLNISNISTLFYFSFIDGV